MLNKDGHHPRFLELVDAVRKQASGDEDEKQPRIREEGAQVQPVTSPVQRCSKRNGKSQPQETSDDGR